tara:strand:+ start:760 stop:1311 length:552 start_codon:yes stop_codon:yes gene_type:complete
MEILKRFFSEIEGFKFLIRNIRNVEKLPKIDSKIIGDFRIESCQKSDFNHISKLHKLLRDGRDLNFWRKILYKSKGKKLMFLIKDTNKKIIGFQMFYFKDDEIKNKIIHEAFIGVKSEFRGNNLSVELRKCSIEHFSKTGLSAISTNIPSNNEPSIASAQKTGFQLHKEKTKNNIFRFFYYFK